MTDNLDQLREALEELELYGSNKGHANRWAVRKAAQKYLKLMEGIEGLRNVYGDMHSLDVAYNQALDDVTKLMEE